MALVVVYGFYALFLEAPPSRGLTSTAAAGKLEAINKFISKVAVMTKDSLSDIDSYVVENMTVKWTKDPLLNTQKDIKFDNSGSRLADANGEQLGINYTGFLQMGNKSMAIINGLEYESGDTLQPEGYTVGAIYPNRVIILIRGGKQRVSVSLEETQ